MMVEDNLGDAMLISEMLKETCSQRFLLQHNLQLSTAFECLSYKNFDLILLDLGLPDSLGLDTLRKVLDKFPGIPVVIMTGLDDEELGFEAVKMGAQDYLIKGQIDSNLLFRTIRYSIERKRTQEIIREKEERFRATFEQAAVGIAHLTLEGSWILINRKFCQMTGHSHPELLRLKLQDIMEKESIPLDLKSMSKSLPGQTGSYSVEKRLVNKISRQEIWTRLTFSLVNSESDKPAYLILVAEDISEMKNIEKSLQEA
jgi:PAS domain S-box-containing protein